MVNKKKIIFTCLSLSLSFIHSFIHSQNWHFVFSTFSFIHDIPAISTSTLFFSISLTNSIESPSRHHIIIHKKWSKKKNWDASFVFCLFVCCLVRSLHTMRIPSILYSLFFWLFSFHFSQKFVLVFCCYDWHGHISILMAPKKTVIYNTIKYKDS